MHKKIVDSVKQVVYGRLKDKCEIFVRTSNSGGFWGMIIILDEDKKHFLAHIESIALSIGQMYGEGLHTKRLNEYTLYLD